MQTKGIIIDFSFLEPQVRPIAMKDRKERTKGHHEDQKETYIYLILKEIPFARRYMRRRLASSIVVLRVYPFIAVNNEGLFE